MTINQLVFFELLRAGLWKKEARLSQYKDIDYSAIMKLAEEQFVVGLITAGLEYVSDVKVPKEVLLQFIGSTLQIEQQNKAMNEFVAWIIDLLRKQDVYSLLVKGQGIAQCYEKPLWRASGDVDLYLSESYYQKAKSFLAPLASNVEKEDEKRLHLGMTINSWIVELHGTMHSDYSIKVNKGLDDVHRCVFYGGEVRSWDNGGVTILLPSADNDVIIIFTHILQHFFVEGIGLRQICDWCRLLWTYRDKIDMRLLEKRLKYMGLMSNWKAFAALAVDWLGMPAEEMPLYNKSRSWKEKGNRIIVLILDTGNFGHNRDMSYKQTDTYFVRLAKSFNRRNKDAFRQFMIFPLDTLRMWWKMFLMGIGVAFKGR